MEIEQGIALLGAITTAVNIGFIIFFNWKKNTPEVKKLEVEGDSGLVSAANVNLEGAKISSEMLIDRIEELKNDLAAEKRARRDDAEYFRRRIKDIEKEARDYRLWAARLAKQVIEVGKVPVPFISSLNDTDPLISAINKEQEQLDTARSMREEELKNEKE